METSCINSSKQYDKCNENDKNINYDYEQNEIPQLTDFQEETLQYNFKMINLMLYNLNKEINQMIESLSKRKKFPSNKICFDKMIEDIESENYVKTLTDNNNNITQTKKNYIV